MPPLCLHYRLLNKDGRPTIRLHPLRLGACWGYVRDIWSTLVDLRWRYMLLIFTGTFILSWVIFALLWYLLAYAHGDLQPGQPHNHTACVHSINSMRAAFSFAVETQLTIGYGTMYPSGECPLAVALLTMHMILGLMLEAFITGVFVAKLARPKLRSESLRFSRNAVLCKVGERGPMSLVIRVANLRQSPLLNVRLEAVLYDSRTAGHITHHCPYFLFPLTFFHKPNLQCMAFFWQVGGGTLPPGIELAVFLTATLECTGEVCQQRTSYIGNEIVSGKRFGPALVVGSDGCYMVNLKNFDQIISETEMVLHKAESRTVVKFNNDFYTSNEHSLNITS
uniref:Potassium inwardly rectifying channel subfamily J member 13 n=1 Tax=Eptatretus burgeri TaxID=7764 RepID=A0A8C4QVD5_EPTBU